MKRITNIRDDFPTILLNKMHEQNINKADLARMIDVCDSCVHRYVQGKNKPYDLILKRIAEALNCSIEEFICK